MAPPVLLDVAKQIAVITLNRPERRNAINQQLLVDLYGMLETVAANDDVRVVIITGNGPSFCAGLDLDAIGRENLFDPRGDGKDLPDLMRACDKPIIAAVNGHAITGGFELALNCDFIIAAENAQFSDTHARVGIHPGWGMTQLLQQTVGQRRAKQISFTCQPIFAHTALAWGLVNEVLPREHLLDRAKTIATQIVQADPKLLGTIKGLIENLNRGPLETALDTERRGFKQFVREQIKQVQAIIEGIKTMGRYLMLDIGAGTLDMLYYDSNHDLHYKAVVRSPVRVLADDIRKTSGNLVVTGGEMGGGPVSQALIDRAKTAQVVMSAPSAATIHHDRERVTGHGIRVADRAETEQLKTDSGFHHITIGDLQPDRLRRIVEGMGVPFEFDAIAICAQDHGVAPPGVSHLDYRHQLFTAALERDPVPQALMYRSEEVPESLNRLTTIAHDALHLPADRIYVMDSGMAAILGASMDRLATDKENIIVLDIATSHTVGAAMQQGQLCAFFEYHTKDITVERLDQLLKALPEGRLSHRQILNEGGHGAYSYTSFDFADVQLILSTGPKRRMIAPSSLPITLGAPWGDNMMTGTVGLLEAVRQREGLPPITYL